MSMEILKGGRSVKLMIIHVLTFKIVRTSVKCIASLFCYNHLAVCKTHAVVV